MRIGELARQSGVPATALRYYEQFGPLPEPGRTDSGYRVYGEDAVDRLAFIRAARAVGLTLAEVRQVLGVRDAGEAPCRVVTDLIDPPARRCQGQDRRVAPAGARAGGAARPGSKAASARLRSFRHLPRHPCRWEPLERAP